jgi:hypothetical protein
MSSMSRPWSKTTMSSSWAVADKSIPDHPSVFWIFSITGAPCAAWLLLSKSVRISHPLIYAFWSAISHDLIPIYCSSFWKIKISLSKTYLFIFRLLQQKYSLKSTFIFLNLSWDTQRVNLASSCKKSTLYSGGTPYLHRHGEQERTVQIMFS